MSVKEGLVISKMCLPERIKIDIRKLDGEDRWSLHYIETLTNDAPKEAIENTVKVVERVGIHIKKRGKTLFYKVAGTSSQVFTVILGESLAISKFGDLTLREIMMLATAGRIVAEMAQAKNLLPPTQIAKVVIE